MINTSRHTSQELYICGGNLCCAVHCLYTYIVACILVIIPRHVGEIMCRHQIYIIDNILTSAWEGSRLPYGHEPVFSWTRHPNTVRALPGEQIVFSPWPTKFSAAAALGQGQPGAVRFTVLAGKPHCEAVIFKELKISMPRIPRVQLYSGCPVQFCKRRAQLRQRQTLVHTHLTTCVYVLCI